MGGKGRSKGGRKPIHGGVKKEQHASKGKGNGKGKERGVMMWVPLSQVSKLQGTVKPTGKQQKGAIKGGKGGHFSKRKSLGQRVAAEKRIWLAGLPIIEDREKRKEASKKLQEQFNVTLDCKSAEIWRNGHGYAVFGSEEDAQVA